MKFIVEIPDDILDDVMDEVGAMEACDQLRDAIAEELTINRRQIMVSEA